MNGTEFTYLLQNPASINENNTQQLQEIIDEFPYFQAARALQLKGLHASKNFKYNQALKKTAAYTIDRKLLFEFITSPIFTSSKELSTEIEEKTAEDFNETSSNLELENSVEEHYKSEQNQEIEHEKETIDLLKIGEPLQFNVSEPHSFNEWMRLVAKKPIVRDNNKEKSLENPSNAETNFSLIDKFIETKPKIKPVDKQHKNVDISLDSSSENKSLMTETLAKVYLEQKKYESAIKAYHILSLKYPEKSGFFADRIKAIKILQRNKS